MARKLKINPNREQPGLFDLFEGMRGITDNDMPTHPSISDFVVESVSNAKSADTDTSDSMVDIEVDIDSLHRIDALKFISFGSGSSGNCAYLGDSECGILIDAGIDPDTVKKGLKENGLAFGNIKGICLTHDHSDHVRFIYPLVRKHPEIKVYCTPKTLNGLLRRHSISRRIKDYHHPIYKEFEFNIGNFIITAFDVSHDGTDNAGFFITHGNHSFAIATDLGCITPRVDYYMRQARYIMIEANYDAQMLKNGTYPLYLKSRIASGRGHLDNTVTGRFLAECYSPNLRYIFLCHLSQDNNTPDIAIGTVAHALYERGITDIGNGSGSADNQKRNIQLIALPRFKPSELYTLRLD